MDVKVGGELPCTHGSSHEKDLQPVAPAGLLWAPAILLSVVLSSLLQGDHTIDRPHWHTIESERGTINNYA